MEQPARLTIVFARSRPLLVGQLSISLNRIAMLVEAASGRVTQARQTGGSFDGDWFTRIAKSSVGYEVQVHVKDGQVYEGVLMSINPKMDVRIEVTLDSGNEKYQALMNFFASEISLIRSKDEYLDTGVEDLTGGAANRFHVTKIDLQLLVHGMLNKTTGGLFACEVSEVAQSSVGGWDAKEMFRINEERFGVHSTYDPSLSMYTTPLVQNDDYRQRRRMAAKMAKEIRNSHRYEGSEKSPPSEFLTSGASPQDCSDMKFQRPMSKPADPDAWSQGRCVCKIDRKPVQKISSFDGQLGNILKVDVEKKKKEEEDLLKIQEELRQQQQEILQQKEEMEKQKQEFERQIQLELQKMEEVRQQKEEERRRKAEEEEELHKIEEAQKQKELRREQEEMKRISEELRMECMAKEQEVENSLHKIEELKSSNEDDSANTKEGFVKYYDRNPERHNDSQWDTPKVVKVGVLARIGAMVLGAITKCIRS